MSVLIKGMEMPETCSDCEWSYYVGNGRAMCKRVSMTDKTDIMTKRRADFCPLIEVPTPHGRLIDADALIADLVKYQNMLDPESRENARVLSVKSYLTLARGEAIIEAED